ncbi:MAG: interferon alpha-inducible IFI6/IFI27 family protein [Proteobacteria bacterium]|nr:interferon alpha-inducible IFI6/IFI27 family protein [Pseudomonadota bacterium]
MLIFSPCKSAQEEDSEPRSEPCTGYSWTTIAFGAAVGTAIGVGAVVATPAVLSVVGFSANGIVGGSVAATVQAAIGNVGSGTVFATLQSIGASGGLSATAAGATTVATTATGAVAGAAFSDSN